ncbi:hypothetical protein CCACVL1_04618 [Corchorus capsularis]|uniref:Uncharacterized protein n=1 Tax=Corchorus capsularis TaxID=210143 RepID=A0A1R3JQS6_COCAP|nr:hypothetical protein CCACVL1_04618 [Corchorus capsularis]
MELESNQVEGFRSTSLREDTAHKFMERKAIDDSLGDSEEEENDRTYYLNKTEDIKEEEEAAQKTLKSSGKAQKIKEMNPKKKKTRQPHNRVSERVEELQLQRQEMKNKKTLNGKRM